MPVVGTSVVRKEGWAKVTGSARYVDDLSFPGVLHGRTVRTSIACGTLDAIRYDFDPEGYTVVTAGDIPGRNVISLIVDDQPCLVDRVIGHAAEPVVLLAHADREALSAAVVHLECTATPPVLEPAASRHAFKSVAIERGDLAQGWRDADIVVEGQYRAGHQEQLYIEPNGMIAVPEDRGVTIYGSLQCPYYVHQALCALLGLPPGRVRVVQAETGGGFGGKEEYPSIIAGHAALLALKSGRPVKLVYDRREDMLATTKRHPAVVRHRTGVTLDGRLVAMDIDVLLDGGAYTTLSPVVLSRGVIHATGPYRCPNVRIGGRVVRTNTPPNGAFRGFGAPQTLFAAEVHMDRIAEALGMDPAHVREINALRPGDTTATGQVLGNDCAALDVLREAVRRTRFSERRRELAGTTRGIGLSLFFHGAGFTGAGEVRLASRATLETTARGVRIRVANTEIGQGARTVLAQVVADAMDMDYSDVDVHEADTHHVPDSGPTVASRTCMIVGRLLERCAATMRERLGELSPADHYAKHGRMEVTEEYERPPGLHWDDDAYQGDAYGCFGYGCDVVEVELDPVTYEVRPVHLTAVVEIGKVLHPTLATGQIEGGSAQALGYALIEDVVMRDGRMANAELTNYLIPTTQDVPPMDVVMLERPYASGPQGAKGLGELPMDGPAPAVVNAIRHLGLDLREIPATPERVMEASCGSL